MRISRDRAVYVISVAAELAGVHPQTLRIYERKGLLAPARTSGRSRRYSEHDIQLLRRIQELTNEGISLAIGAKVPGQGMRIRTVHMDFMYGGTFRTELPEAYERLILDAMLGDQTLFTRSDEVEEQWALVDAIVASWKRDRPAFPNYPAGTWGPAAADDLIRRDGREWLGP